MAWKGWYWYPVISLAVVALIATTSGTMRRLSLDRAATATSAFSTAIAYGIETAEARTPSPTPTSLPTATSTPTPTLAPLPVQASCIPDNPRQSARVVKIVDADTIRVVLDVDGQEYPLRYVGIDAAENGSEAAQEAAEINRDLVDGKQVILVRDVSDTDRYNRLLRYVVVGDLFVNRELVARGAASAVSYPPDTACDETLSLTLGGAAPTLVAVPTGRGVSSGCTCSGPDLDCRHFASSSDAQACLELCVSLGIGDFYHLDGDADGLACEPAP